MSRTRAAYRVRARRATAALVTLAVLGGAGQAAAGLQTRGHPTGASSATYTVRRGDTLSTIAVRYGTTVDHLARLNGIANVHYVRAGTKLRLTGAPPAASGAKPAARADGPKPTTKLSKRYPAPKLTRAQLARLPEGLRTRPERLALVPVFDAAARTHQVPPDLLKAMAWMESGWQNDKVSSAGAIGIGQVMPDTVAFVNGVLLRARLDPGLADHNVQLSARYLRWLLAETQGDVRQALAGYYQGLASVRRHGPLPETDHYVDAVLALRGRF